MTVRSPLGPAVPNWTPRELPQRIVLTGRTVRLEPLDPHRHEQDLWEAAQGANENPDFWNYLGYGPYTDRAVFHRDLVSNTASTDPLFSAVVDLRSGQAEGVASLLRIDAPQGVLEVGHIWFGPTLMRTTAATEAIFLFGDYAFTELGYRRFEWKCNSLNAPSMRAAQRFGFVYEGTFRNHMISKGHSRDTAWFSMTDSEWPAVRKAFVAWLDPSNFDANDRQIRTLESFRTS